jgi:hypothetical protein
MCFAADLSLDDQFSGIIFAAVRVSHRAVDDGNLNF